MSRERGDHVVPTGPVTFLLTDVEGSTRQWETDPGGTRAAVSRLGELIDELVAGHGGVRPVEQGEGDSAVAAFQRPLDAVAVALKLQQKLGGDPRSAIGLRVRVGIHTGEAHVDEAGRYLGEALNRCARLREIGHGGQILLSQTTFDLVQDHLPEETVTQDLGEHRLRDLTRPERVHQVHHREATAEFPALRSLDSVPNNLPLNLTSFIGREREISQVEERMSSARLLTLTGSGGCGKTRLAVQIAADLLDRYQDGVWLVDLAPVGDPDLVPNVVAAVFGLHERPFQDSNQMLTDFLSHKEILLVLDNCEHLIAACAELAHRLLIACPDVSILATSREPLGVEGEVSWRVPSLTLPAADLDVASVEDYESVRLFADRARRARPSFELTSEIAPMVVDVCRRLDGIPLAIELAASRVRLLSVEEIASGIGDSLRLLSGGARTTMARQQTLLASVDWSFRLLDDTERVLLRRLSVFPSGFTLAAAERTCSDVHLPDHQVFDALTGLVDKSLAQLDGESTPSRYRLLETIRQYAAQKLVDADETQESRDRQLDYFLDFVQPLLGADLLGYQLPEKLGVLDQELENLRAAMDWGETSAPDKGLQIVGAMGFYWFLRGHWSEGIRRALAAKDLEGIDARIRAEALLAGAHVAAASLDMAGTTDFAEPAFEIGRQLDDRGIMGRAAYALGLIRGFADAEAGRAYLEQALELLHDSPYRLRVLNTLAISEVAGGQLLSARGLLEDVRQQAIANGYLPAIMTNSFWLSVVAQWQGDLDHAQLCAEDGVDAARNLRNPQFLSWNLACLGGVALGRGQLDRAMTLLNEAVTIADSGGDPIGRALGLAFRATTQLAAGDLAAADEDVSASLRYFEGLGIPWWVGTLWLFRSDIRFAEGNLDEALSAIDRASDSASMGAGNIYVTEGCRHRRARLLRITGDLDQAEVLQHEALRNFAKIGAKPDVVAALEELGAIAIARESPAEGCRLLGAADGLRSLMGAQARPVERSVAEASIADARAALSEDELKEAWEEGSALSLEEAVSYASRGRGERKRPSSGWDSLTPAELDVVRLVIEGLTNPQIGEKLFISKRTVQAHLSNVFAKLGLSSRTELATEATRRGVGTE